jgi:hypothetical protein
VNRQTLAVLLAPLWVPLGFAPYAALYVFPYSARAQEWVAIVTLLSIALAYAGMFVVGVPVFVALHRRGWANAWTMTTLGVVIILGGWLLVSSSLGPGVDVDPDFMALTVTGEPILLALFGGLGALAGLTAWLIGKP